MTEFTPSLSERNRILKQIRRKNPWWKVKITLSTLLLLLPVGILAGTYAWLSWCDADAKATLVFMLAAVCISGVPFCVGLGSRNSAIYKCGQPFSGYANGILRLKEDELEYVFWEVGSGMPAAYGSKNAVYCEEAKSVYSIPRLGIVVISVDGDICTIRGKGKIQRLEDEECGESSVEYCNSFRFILAFEQSGAIQSIEQWWGWSIKK